MSYDASMQKLRIDPTENILVANLLGEALKLLECDRSGARRRIENAQALMLAVNDDDRTQNAPLPAWRLRRAETYIRDHLDTRLRLEAVAQAVNLSPSHFSRAFRATKGISYSEFVVGCRVARAKQLLLCTELPIAQIALDCGLTDQSHLTRVFSRAVGTPPRAWRRRRMIDPCVEDLEEPTGR